jgi:hypothetical protein
LESTQKSLSCLGALKIGGHVLKACTAVQLMHQGMRGTSLYWFALPCTRADGVNIKQTSTHRSQKTFLYQALNKCVHEDELQEASCCTTIGFLKRAVQVSTPLDYYWAKQFVPPPWTTTGRSNFFHPLGLLLDEAVFSTPLDFYWTNNARRSMSWETFWRTTYIPNRPGKPFNLKGVHVDALQEAIRFTNTET